MVWLSVRLLGWSLHRRRGGADHHAAFGFARHPRASFSWHFVGASYEHDVCNGEGMRAPPLFRFLSARGASSYRSLGCAAVLAFGTTTLVANTAVAEMIIKRPGDHLSSVELEPHLVFRLFDTPNRDVGLGLGFRATVPIVKNGFVPSINNSVGIGFGLDYMQYDACGRVDGRSLDCGKVRHLALPVVMQWNFFLTPAWSVFGEPGLVASFYSYKDEGCRSVVFARGTDRYDACPDRNTLDPVLFVGARWHFGDTTTLTMRAGWPWWSVGVSFL